VFQVVSNQFPDLRKRVVVALSGGWLDWRLNAFINQGFNKPDVVVGEHDDGKQS